MQPDTAGWRSARLITADGIRGPQEQESRATSALLSVMMAVPEFGRSILAYAKAPRGRISTFTEVPLQVAGNGRSAKAQKLRPDGAILVERGRTRWACLVEVKTGPNMQTEEQVGAYLDLAREHGFDAVLTISNELAAEPGVSPLKLPKAKLRNVALVHLSWWRVLTEAVVQHEHRGVEDPDQAWILGELIAFLREPRSGAGHFDDLGPDWVRVRDNARHGTLGRGAECDSVVAGWEDFARYVCLDLSQSLGENVEPVYPRRMDVPARRAEAARRLVEAGCLDATIRIPRAAGDLDVHVDLRARQVTTSVRVAATDEQRPATRIRRMVRQLKEAPDDLRLEVHFRGGRETTKCLLREAREDEACLLHPSDPKREPREFTIAMTNEMRVKKGADSDSFVGATRRQINDFYAQVVQGLVAPAPRPPRMRTPEPGPDADEAAETGGDQDPGGEGPVGGVASEAVERQAAGDSSARGSVPPAG